jgi:hypothetical protein
MCMPDDVKAGTRGDATRNVDFIRRPAHPSPADFAYNDMSGRARTRPEKDMPQAEDPANDIELRAPERKGLERDLGDVDLLKEILGEQGVKGASFYCSVCEDQHYLSWDLLGGNIKQLLDAGEAFVHEPAYLPDPEEYVTWEYAQGFLDGFQLYLTDDRSSRTLKVVLELRAAESAG